MIPSPVDWQLTFLAGMRVRVGTNYLARMVGKHPQVQFLPPGQTTSEVPLLTLASGSTPAWLEFLRSTPTADFRRRLSLEAFAPYQGAAVLAYLAKTFGVAPGPVFIKCPTLDGVARFFEYFPAGKLILLMRDGRDQVASFLRAAQARRTSQRFGQRVRATFWRGGFKGFVAATIAWRNAARTLLALFEALAPASQNGQMLVVRYEEAVQNPRLWARRVFSLMGLEVEDEVVEAAARAEVVGSSFFGADGCERAAKPNWHPTPRNENFQPIGRWHQWGPVWRWVFSALAERELRAIGYPPTRGKWAGARIGTQG